MLLEEGESGSGANRFPNREQTRTRTNATDHIPVQRVRFRDGVSREQRVGLWTERHMN